MNLKNMRECDKSKNTCKQQLPIVYMSFNNVGHLITSTITTLQHFATLYHTSPNLLMLGMDSSNKLRKKSVSCWSLLSQKKVF